MLLPNGSMIKNDVIECFNSAIPANTQANGNVDWEGVENDMFCNLGPSYNPLYIEECVEVLADEFELNASYDRLQVLKADYLGMEA